MTSSTIYWIWVLVAGIVLGTIFGWQLRVVLDTETEIINEGGLQ